MELFIENDHLADEPIAVSEYEERILVLEISSNCSRHAVIGRVSLRK